ncbi:thioredoxin [Litorimonas taeanensis]|uniref:Thioredoxin n=1 Tax=Litorimonas taeanensis TaxID=568099 RepID=A0A420WEN2_9PROT|nr:thioredoxin [Litorimonas taeanensis]RKQ69415.1 thioredoxin [Litorimonas taeanensis]
MNTPSSDTASNMTADIIKDSSDMAFMADVVEASKETPVVVDFWAPWCGPCKQLMPALERAVKGVSGKVKMVKINIDENPGVAGQLGVRSIPAVFAFKDGKPVDGFMGGQPESELDKFIGRLAGEVDPSAEAQSLVERARDSLAAGDIGGAAQDYAQALSLDEANPSARAGLAQINLDSGNDIGAAELISNTPVSLVDHPEIAAIRSKLALIEAAPEPDAEDPALELAQSVENNPDNLDARLELAKAYAATGRNAQAVEQLLYSIRKNRAHNDEAARLFLLTIFEAEGPQSEVSINGRRELSSILFA